MSDGVDPNVAARASRTGVAIVVVAVLVAVVVLARGYDSGRSEISVGSSKATTTTVATTTTLASKVPAEVKVKVVNATNVQGLAGKVRDILEGRGYTQISVGDATTKQLQTEIYYQPGAEPEAQAVARALGLGASSVKPMPDPPPVSPADSVVLVLAGVDLG